MRSRQEFHGMLCLACVHTVTAVDRDFQHLLRDLANVNILENNVWSLLLHKFNEIFVKFGKTMTLYSVTIWQSRRGSTVSLISVFLVQEHQNGCHHSIRPRCFRNIKLVALQLSLLLHKFNEIFVKFGKTMALYCHHLAVKKGKHSFFNICLPGPRASKWLSSFYSTSVFQKYQVGCFTTVTVIA